MVARSKKPAMTDAGLLSSLASPAPLADRLRPNELDELIGQADALGPDGPLRQMLASGRIGSLILWGPPGCGKTTIARLLARDDRQELVEISAVFAGVAELRDIFARARARRADGNDTILFVDEIHRFHKGQQDALLGVVEDGTVILIGATTENPSFALIPALLSRCRVIVLTALSETDLQHLLRRAEARMGRKLTLDDAARRELCTISDGDGRYLLNMAENLFTQTGPVDSTLLYRLVQRRAPLYDRAGDAHYSLISALHKSVRGGDVDATLYWLARMLVGGEDPRYLARRLTRMAVEDIGLAAPDAVAHALAAWQTVERLGQPEGDLALAQIAAELAAAPKSIALYRGFTEACRDAKRSANLMPPAFAVNAPTNWMKAQGFGAGYRYDPEEESGFSGLDYFPPGERKSYYRPSRAGFDVDIAGHMAAWQRAYLARNPGRAPVSAGADEGRLILADHMAEPDAIVGIDHVLLMVADLDAAERKMAEIGFCLTPRGIHSEHMGTMNATAVFRAENYLELLAVARPTPANEMKLARLQRGPGAFGIAFRTQDAARAQALFAAAGVGEGGVLEFSRPIGTPDGDRQASFSTTMLSAEATGIMRSFVCQHHTPELVYRPEYQEHANGAEGLRAIWWATDRLSFAHDCFARIPGITPQLQDGVVSITFAKTCLYFTDPARFSALHPVFPDAQEGACALWLHVANAPMLDCYRQTQSGIHQCYVPECGSVLVCAEHGGA